MSAGLSNDSTTQKKYIKISAKARITPIPKAPTLYLAALSLNPRQRRSRLRAAPSGRTCTGIGRWEEGEGVDWFIEVLGVTLPERSSIGVSRAPSEGSFM